MEDNKKDSTGTSAASSQDEWQYERQLARAIDAASKDVLWSMLVENTENIVRSLSKNAKGLNKLQVALAGRNWEEEQPILEALHRLNTVESRRLLLSYVYGKLDESRNHLLLSIIPTLIGVGGVAWFVRGLKFVAGYPPLFKLYMLWLPALLMLALPLGLVILVVSIHSIRKDPSRKDPRWYSRYLAE